MGEQQYVVRLWDGMDGLWIDVSEAVSQQEAQTIWNANTKNGTQKTKYEDIDYYEIFPANTRMKYSYESGLSQTRRL